MPLLATDSVPLVALTIDARDHLFVVDTGSGELVLDRALKEELDLPDFGTRETTFAGGRRAPVTHSLMPEVTFDGVTVENVPVEVMDVRRRAPQLSGGVGLQFLLHFRPTFDYERKQLLLAPPTAPLSPPAEAVEVPLRLFEGHVLVAPGAFNGHETFVALASGMAGGGFTCPATTVQQAGLSVDTDDAVPGVSVEGGEALVPVTAERLRLGPLEHRDVAGFVGGFTPSLEWRYGFRIGGVVAHDVLRRYRWTIDPVELTGEVP